MLWDRLPLSNRRQTTSMKCIAYFVTAFFWNLAIFAAACWVAAIPLDIAGSTMGSEMLRGFAYAAGFLGTIAAFWFALFAAVLSIFVKCHQCGKRVLSTPFPFFVPLRSPTCTKCGGSYA